MTLNCAIVDDEPLALDLLESYVRRTPYLNLVGRYSSAVAAMKGLEQHKADLLPLCRRRLSGKCIGLSA